MSHRPWYWLFFVCAIVAAMVVDLLELGFIGTLILAFAGAWALYLLISYVIGPYYKPKLQLHEYELRSLGMSRNKQTREKETKH
ncbi:hypothetical protein GWO13_07330 [Candidatus Bathyarchaeota archaeon]|nr:hypothetical protein [Candidatus Bathyarchaeota archaeon]